MINWIPKQDCFIEGNFDKVRIYINADKKNVVRSLYLIGDKGKEKFFPESEIEMTIIGMKAKAERLLNDIKTLNMIKN